MEEYDLDNKGAWPEPLQKLWEDAQKRQQRHTSGRTYRASDPLANFKSGRWGEVQCDGRER